MPTKIEWCDETWNPVRTRDGGYHCTKLSPGCDHCYAEVFNNRFGNHRPYDASTPDYVVNETVLHQLFHWHRQRRIFVESMSDLGLIGMRAPSVLGRVMSVIAQSIGYARDPQFAHTFILLTKRPDELFHAIRTQIPDFMRKEMGPHLEIGVTAEDQERADDRIPKLFHFRDLFPRCKLFVSIEPMLGPVDFSPWLPDYTSRALGAAFGIDVATAIDGIIVGGETGKKARAMKPEWVRAGRDACILTRTPLFFKGWGKAIPSIADSIGDVAAAKAPKIDLFLRDFRRYLDGEMWEQLPGSKI